MIIRQEIGSDEFAIVFVVLEGAVQEANAAGPHHADEQLLLPLAILLPDQAAKLRAGKASAGPTKFLECALPVELSWNMFRSD